MESQHKTSPNIFAVGKNIETDPGKKGISRLEDRRIELVFKKGEIEKAIEEFSIELIGRRER